MKEENEWTGKGEFEKKRNTDRKLYEECFHALADYMAQLAWIADEKGYRFWFNKRWYDYTGTTFQESEGWGYKKFYHPDYLEKVVEKLEYSWGTGKPWEDTFPLRGKDGNYRWFLSRALPISDQCGKILCWFGTNTDITEQKLLQQKLEETLSNLSRSNKELNQFANIAAHDLKEPLRTISLFAKLLEKRYKENSDDAEKEYISFIINGAKRMNDLIQDLLSFARLNKSGTLWQKIDCNGILNEVIESLSASIREKNAIINVDLLPEIQGDPIQIKQLFQNLISNSLKFCRDKTPEISVSCTLKDKDYIFSVKDNGIGIAEEFRDVIFDLFQRLHTRDEYPGTGIGLSICKKIVENHKGTLWVESTLGEGSIFYFSMDNGTCG